MNRIKYAIACLLMSPLLILIYGVVAIAAFGSVLMATMCWILLWALYTVFGAQPSTWKSWFMYFFDEHNRIRPGLFKPWTWGASNAR